MGQSITDFFGDNLARILAQKIKKVYPAFDARNFVQKVCKEKEGKTYSERVELLADMLYEFLPKEYERAVNILLSILGPENEHETGMFTHFYWIMPIGKFVEKYGLNDFKLSIRAIEEITKRNTGEYAIRPFIQKYPKQSLVVLTTWAKSHNFHLRRLASEGARPKLPWAPKLDVFVEHPEPIFAILELLKEDPVRFVRKSVANHMRDYLKVNKVAAARVLARWGTSEHAHTRWIVKHARRKGL